ncbi:twin-arginine translocase subunit TatC [candidate division KSB1 bacterium]|nr:twin-arginine translocase subunit TatC [candidate division KSB1 bacterium]
MSDLKNDNENKSSQSGPNQNNTENNPKRAENAKNKKQDSVDSEYPYGYDQESHPIDSADVENSQDSKAVQAEKDQENQEDYDYNRNPEKRMPFLDHLEELRWTLMKSIAAIIITAVVAYLFSREIIAFLRLPAPDDLKLIFLGPTEGFMVHIKVALFTGLVAALPVVAYQFWKFVVPGLLSKEKQLVPPIVFFTVICFFVGALFAYTIIIPLGMKFLLGFQSEYLEANITINKYLGFVVTIILVFGVVFELPVLAFFLTKVGVVNPNFLSAKRRYGIVIIFILAAMLTPPDIFTQLLLAFPLIGLYEISIWVARFVYDEQLEKEGVIKKLKIKRPFIVTISALVYLLTGLAGIAAPLIFKFLPQLEQLIYPIFPLEPHIQLFVFVGFGLFLIVCSVAIFTRRNWARWISLLVLPAAISVVYYFIGYSVWFAVPVGLYLLLLLFLILPVSANYFTQVSRIQLREQD